MTPTERVPDKYDVKAARVHGTTVEEVRGNERPAFVARFDPSFGAVFVLVFKVYLSLIILSIPIAIAIVLLGAI